MCQLLLRQIGRVYLTRFIRACFGMLMRFSRFFSGVVFCVVASLFFVLSWERFRSLIRAFVRFVLVLWCHQFFASWWCCGGLYLYFLSRLPRCFILSNIAYCLCGLSLPLLIYLGQLVTAISSSVFPCCFCCSKSVFLVPSLLI